MSGSIYRTGPMSSSSPSFDFEVQRLRAVRHVLLRLHKALLESERESYEQHYGPIHNNSEFFRLVIGHEWFDWLRPMSQFIVQIDELFDTKEPIDLTQVTDLLSNASLLLRASEEGSLAEQRYYHAIQRNPDIAFMHAEMLNLLKTKT
ncbi:hypothetical protein OsccyDRAFT_3108 [Leptolyngbyaceae cyanobacterium JSC-12]|nr:hypothetical protein OsccyDRAFT_3108 [Leptolyngbyaceae cyanobacterium JSC-12]